MNKVLIIKSNVDLFFNLYDNVDKYFCCKFSNVFLRLFRKLNLPLYLFLSKWKKDVKKYSTFILFDNGYTDYISKYIKKKNPNSRIIFWYWNSLIECNYKIVNSKNIDEIWTYNMKDAKANNLNYNPQFYSNKINIPESKNEYDVLFLGSDKGRKQNLLTLEKKLNAYNIITNFKIVENKSDYVSYDGYLKLLSSAKCIVDYCISKVECGLSLRVMESIFLKKKLITNNYNVKEYNFYDPNNIFILGLDDESKLYDFINSDYKKIDDNIIEEYDFYSWLNRFQK